MRARSAVAILLVFVGIAPTNAQTLTFAKYAGEEGLASSWVYGVAQDSSGFIWVASGGGLQRFDGYAFSFLRSSGAPESRLYSMPTLSVHVDRQGHIWAGTYTAGLVRVDPDSERTHFYGPIEGDTTSLSSPAVTSITSGRGSYFWVSTIDGFHRFDPATGTFLRFRDPRAPIVLHTMEDRRGTVWAGTTLGLLRLRPGAGQAELITSAEYLASPWVRKIYEDRTGRLWFATSRGLRSYDPTTGRTVRHVLDPTGGPNDSIIDVLEGADGSIWIATHGGLYQLDAAGRVRNAYRHDVSDPSSLSSDDPSALCIDRSGVLWIGTQTGWLNRAEVAKARFVRLTAFPRKPWSLSHRNVADVAAGANGRVWFATPAGVQMLDLPNMRMQTVSLSRRGAGGEPGRPIALFEDRRGSLWVGTNQHAFVRVAAGKTTSFILPHPVERKGLPDLVSHISEDRNGVLWIGTAMGGVRTFDRTNGRWGSYVVSPWPTQNYVTGIVRDRRGIVWVATAQGGLLRIADDGIVTRLVKDSSWLPTNQVNDVAAGPDGRIWLATHSGVVAYDPDVDSARVFAHIDDDGLPTAFGSLVRADDGTWWAGASSGLFRFDPSSDSFRRFTVADGVQGQEFTVGGAARLSDGRLVFGGTSGATVVDPSRLDDNRIRPPVVITGLFVGDSALSPVGPAVRSGLQVPFGDHVLSVSVAALDFRAPEMNRFWYRLDGLSDAWRKVEGRTLTFTHLDAGTYVLRVRGTNNDGLEGVSEATLAIEVLPPWWLTWWFRFLIVGGLVMTVALVIRLRVAAIVREERLRAKIARDLHDDVSSTLSSILVFAEAVRTDRRRDAGRRRHYLDLIAESARSARDMIGDIIWSVDPQHDDWPSFLSKCERYASDLFESAGIAYDLQIEKSVSLDLDLVLRRNLWLIFKEVVTNLVRHSNASRAKVVIRSGNAHLLIVVSDDGRGFDQSRVRRGNGLSNIERRAAEIGAVVEVESRPGGGTTWNVQLRKGA